jgi:hypothetical protein
MIEFIKNIQIDKIYFGCDVFHKINNHFKNHPNYLEKTSKGLKGYVYSNNPTWGKYNYCFWIITDNNERVSISLKFKNKYTNIEKEETTKAFRTSIDSEIIKFKHTFIAGVTKCAITNQIINNKNEFSVDHHNHDFAIIVQLFLKKYNKTFLDLYKYVIQVDSKRYFTNKKLINHFVEFHNNNTTLRFTLTKANLTKKREKLT